MKPVELSPDQLPADTSDLRDAGAATGVQPSRPASDRIGAIWEAMRAGWAAGNPLRAEAFLTPEFMAACGEDGAIDIIYGEFALAEVNGGKPTASDYLARFPQFASGLAKQLSLHAAIELVPSGSPSGKDSSSDLLQCPGQFGRYLLVAPLDSGGQSQVYRAVHPDLGKEVVLKIAREGDLGAALSAEAKILAELSHPNLARIYDAGVIDGRAYLTMEYVRGRTLAQHARFTQLTPEEMVVIIAKTARALAVVHAHGILHLDIKPKNIVIDEHGEPRLIDFGLSRQDNAWSSAANGDGLAGTLEYMAPEQARCEADRLGPPTDIFALGGVLYFLLTGSPLFPGKTVRETLQLAQRCDWDLSRLESLSVPPRLRSCCVRALAAEPEDRYGSAEALAAAVEQAIVAETDDSWRRRGIIIAIACLVLAAFVCFNVIAQRLFAPRPTLPLLFEARIWQDGQRRELSHAVPLQNGDEVQLAAQIPPDHAGAFVLINASGGLQMLRSLDSESSSREATFPDDQSAAPLTGKRGTEAFLVIVGKKAPTADELQSWWSSAGSDWPGLPEFTILAVNDDGIVVEQGSRDLGSPVRKVDPELEVQRRLENFRRQLAERGLRCAGIAVAHQ